MRVLLFISLRRCAGSCLATSCCEWVFDIDDIRTGEHTLALVRSLQFSESNALQPISIARIVSVRCALNSEWSQKKKSRSCGTIVARLRAVFGIHNTKADLSAFPAPKRRRREKIKRSCIKKKSRQIQTPCSLICLNA